MRGNVGNWTLAADSGLLLYLKDFSKRMTERIADMTTQVDGLVTESKRTETRLHNCFNDFLMLSSVQFVENRVYDFEETKEGDTVSGTAEEKPEEAPADKSGESQPEEEKTREQREAELIPRITAALKLGIDVMQNSFDKIEPAQESSKQKDTSGNGGEGDDDDDDDDEEEEKAEMENMEAIFEPKDPYALRPLPYVIGSVQFLQSDDVGLLLAESDESEDEDEEEEEDDSEAEKEKPTAIVSDDGFSDDLDKDSDDDDSESDEDGESKPRRSRAAKPFASDDSDDDEDSDDWSDEGSSKKAPAARGGGDDDDEDVQEVSQTRTPL